jgi:hypothetical protein
MDTGFVVVKNTGKTDFKGRHAGKDFEIAAGETVNMTVADAKHLFGYGLDRRKPKDAQRLLAISHRYGWQFNPKTKKNDLTSDEILDRFDPFEISPAQITAAPTGKRGKGAKGAKGETDETGTEDTGDVDEE